MERRIVTGELAAALAIVPVLEFAFIGNDSETTEDIDAIINTRGEEARCSLLNSRSVQGRSRGSGLGQSG